MNAETISKALNNKKGNPQIRDNALTLLESRETQERDLIVYSAIYLYRFYSDQGKYDSIIIDRLRPIAECLTYADDQFLFLETSKALARLYFKYGKYRQAGNFILYISENTKKENWPGWLVNYRIKIELYNDPEYCFSCPDKILLHAPITGTEDKQRIAIYKEFLRQSYQYFATKAKETTACFLSKLYPIIADNILLFADEWDNLSELIEEVKNANLNTLHVKTIQHLNKLLQADILRLNLEIQERDIQIAKLHEKIEEQKKQPQSSAKVQQIITEHEQVKDEIEFEPRILILGASALKKDEIVKTIKTNFSLSSKSIVVMNDYDKNKQFNISSLKYNSQYDGILIGPIAHSVCGMGDNSSVTQTLKEEGYPPHEELRTKSGGLKLTRTSLKEACSKLLNVIQTNNPSS